MKNKPKPEHKLRINKYLSLCGVASRRKSDLIVEQGRVSVNGKIINEPGILIEPIKDVVMVDGELVELEDKVYYKLYKPPGYISTVKDDKNRKTVMEFFNDIPYSVFPVGRLDMESEGLLIFTNDGDLANRLTHPKYKIEKIYETGINKQLDKSALEKIKNGIKLDEGVTSKCQVEVLYSGKNGMELLIILKQGWKRQIRRMVEHVGAKVTYLKRTFVGPIGLHGLNPGNKRKLNAKELKALKKSLGL